MRQTAVLLPEALRDALGQVIADQRREWRRERELMEAQSRATIAELQAKIASLEAAGAEALALFKDRAEARMALLRDGTDGKDGRDGVDGKDGQDGAPGRDGADGRDGAPGVDGAPGERGDPGADGRDGLDGKDGADGRDGQQGPQGPAGVLPVVRAWTDAVHYASAVVTHSGAAWQAQRDTGRAPPHEDWVCIVAAGRDGMDGRSLQVRGTWAETETYCELDIVALNGASFIARRDEPGPCPGDGWQMVAAQGKRGNAGETGRAGDRGPAGPAGPALVRMSVSREGLLTATNADGTTVEADFYEVLSRAGQ